MLAVLKGKTLAGVDQQAVIDLTPVAGDIAPEDGVPHPEEHFVHAKRVVFGDLFCGIECNPGQGLDHIALEQDVMRLFTIIKPPLNA
jgi:hypothetical protein